MAKYVFNPETLNYDAPEEPKFRRPLRLALLVLAGAALVVLYFWIYISVLGLDLPKTAYLTAFRPSRRRSSIPDSKASTAMPSWCASAPIPR